MSRSGLDKFNEQQCLAQLGSVSVETKNQKYMIQKFVKTVEAIQWTNESGNYPEILDFGQTKIRMASPLVWKEENVKDCLEVQTPNGVLLCPKNYWIVKDGNNYSVSDDALKIGRECW